MIFLIWCFYIKNHSCPNVLVLHKDFCPKRQTVTLFSNLREKDDHFELIFLLTNSLKQIRKQNKSKAFIYQYI